MLQYITEIVQIREREDKDESSLLVREFELQYLDMNSSQKKTKLMLCQPKTTSVRMFSSSNFLRTSQLDIVQNVVQTNFVESTLLILFPI